MLFETFPKLKLGLHFGQNMSKLCCWSFPYPAEFHGENAVQMLSLGACGHGEELASGACEV